jgi:hypothetical protein
VKIIKLSISIVAILMLSALIYIVSTYASKQIVLYYYKWSDAKYDWLTPFKDINIKEKYKIVFIISEPYIVADREAGNRMLAACTNLGWEVYDFETIEGNEEAIRKINPDFIFTNKWNLRLGLKKKMPDYKVYALLPHPTASYFGGLFNFYPEFKEDKYPEAKFLDGFVISMPQVSLFKNYVEERGQKFYGFKGYSSAQYQPFVEVELKQLVYMGMNWDSRRSSNKFTKIFKTLAEREEAVFYGAPDKLQPIVGDAFRSLFKGGASGALDILREHGISLIVHSKQHINSGAPSGRGFETAASGAIGISDRHPFLIENFGDSFLYIDLDASSDRVVAQIENHLSWISQNPEKAKAKARKAYDIFIANFTLESLLLNLAKMHEKILSDESES